MKKLTKLIITGCCITSLAAGAAFTSQAYTAANTGTAGTEDTVSALSPFLVYGTAEKMEDGRLHLTNSDPSAIHNDVIVNTEGARIIDSVTGLPVSYDTLADGQTVYAYIGPAMTLSLPPIANGEVILVNVPADGKIPAYGTVASITYNNDGSGDVTLSDGQSYHIPANCYLFPYRTRNIVTIHDLTAGTPCLIWGESGAATQILVFPQGEEEASEQSGWVQTGSDWVYYDSQGQLHTGWLLEGGDWYYLDPGTGIMETGFISVDGKTYYLKSDGRMETEPFVVTPAADGSLS